MLRLLGVITLAIQSPDSTVILDAGVRSPVFSVEGRLAFELNGDLWVADLPRDLASNPALSASGLQRVTGGPVWDRDPAWTPDGKALVFSSDRSGTFDIWRVAVEAGAGAGAGGSTGAAVRLTEAPEPESEPAVGPDGAVAFVRGRNAAANIWLIADDGGIRQITTSAGGEFSPTFSPSGDRIAYVSREGRNNRLQILALNDSQLTTVLQGVAVEHPSWSPPGERIAYGTRGGRAGVWVTPLDGRYSNLVSEEPGESAWTLDGLHLAIAELPAREMGYNGDPDRLGDRNVGDLFPSHRKFWVASVPAAPGVGLTEIAISVPADREAYNAQAFDRVWGRLQSLYYANHAGAAWSRLRDRYGPRALRAETEEELEDVIYQMLRDRPPFRAEASGRAGVSSAHSLATAAGVEILAAGGNVVDAAVAVSFALGVVEPDASGVVGYGEMLVYLENMDEPVVIEFLTRVPEQASLGSSTLPAGELPRDGPVVANVPGTVAGMHRAWELYGSGNVEWARLVEPAITLAKDGFPLDDGFTTTLALERERFLKYESSRALFFPNGEPLQAGDTLKNPDLAWTLQQIADGGADAFYKGEIAQRMVEDLRGQGNAMTLHDLSRYYAVEREPIKGTYRDHTVYSSVPAASGGTSLVAKLNLLERFRGTNRYTDHAGTLHAMIEAWKLQPSSRGRIADPGLWPVDVTPMLSKDSVRVRWERCFNPQQSTSPEDLADRNGNPACAQEVVSAVLEDGSGCLVDLDDRECRATGTTAFAVADADGNMVAVTQTLGTWGGNFYVSPGLGFLYNDKLNSYSTNPSSYNARLPYARNGTSIAPTLIFRGAEDDRRPMAAVGAAGNAWITSAVYQMVAAMIDADLGPQEALELPRFLIGRRQAGANGARNVVIQIEDGISPTVMGELEAMGHVFQRISLRGELRMGYGAAVLIDGNRVRAGGDPRRSGAGGAVR